MSVIDSLFERIGYQRKTPAPQTVEKADTPQAIAQDPLSQAYASINSQFGVRKGSNITMQTLRRMSRANWVDRACIFTLRDEITGIPWDITPIDPHLPYNDRVQEFLRRLLSKPNRNNENWRTLIDKVVEDILVVDAGTIEKVRNGRDQVVELYHVDGATIKPLYDVHGVIGEPAYQQYVQNKVGMVEPKPVAEFENEDLIYMSWNPSGAIDTFPYGLSPVEAGLAVATAFLNAEAYNLNFFQANAIPPVIIQMGEDVANAEVERFRSFLATEMLGQDGFHKPVVGSFGKDFDIKELMKSPTDMAWKEYVEWQMRWKVALYRMSPQDIGFSLDQYKTEGQVQQQLSKNKAIDSLKGVIKQYIDTEIIGDDGYAELTGNLEFTWIDDETVDPKAQAEIDQIYLTTGVKSINEVRRQAGLDPIAGGSKPTLIVGQNLVTIDPEPITEEQEESGDDEEDQDVHKSFAPEEGTIVPLTGNATAAVWMDDRGVTQPIFVTDDGKSRGFTAKPSFLDDRKGQEPPEAKVAEMLRLLKVNTPEVAIMSEDEVMKLLPTELYPAWTNWINVAAPFNSQEWRDRWGDTRKSDYYIVTGFLAARDLGNSQLAAEMAANPSAYFAAVRDLARVWLAERRFFLGDRKPGHYLITRTGHGYGVDYQFFEDQHSWEKTNHFLPMTLKAIHPSLLEAFIQAIKDEAASFGVTTKSLPTPDAWERMATLTDIEKRFASTMQGKLFAWYTKAVHVANPNRLIRKANGFDPKGDYLVSGSGVYQNGVKYPLSVIPQASQPGPADLMLTPADYRDAHDLGVAQLQLDLKTRFPDLTVRNPELYAPAFAKRVNYLASTVDESLRGVVAAAIINGIDQGLTYGAIGDKVAALLSIDATNPDFPGWRAERIARTESMWAINQGMIDQYKQVGVQQVDIEPASTACPQCMDISTGNPYTLSEAQDMIPAHPNCFPAGTQIQTVSGGKPIEKIQEGDRVLTHTGRFQAVKGISKRWYEGDMIQIRTGRSTVTATPNHPFLTKRGWQLAENIKGTDTLFHLANVPDLNPVKHPSQLFENVGFNSIICKVMGRCMPVAAVDLDNYATLGMTEIEIMAAESDLVDKTQRRQNLVSFDFILTPVRLLGDALTALTTELINPILSMTLTGEGLLLQEQGIAVLQLDGSRAVTGKDAELFQATHQSAHIDPKISRDLPVGTQLIKIHAPENYLNRLTEMFSKLVIQNTSFNHRGAEWRAGGWMRGLLQIPRSAVERLVTDSTEKLLSLGSHIAIIVQRQNNYQGYVYNFEVEEDHSYVANGFVVSNCRCVWVGDWTDILAKALPIVPNQVQDTGFVDENQLKHPTRGKPAFTSFGELISETTKQLLIVAFDVLAAQQVSASAISAVIPLTEIGVYGDLRVATSSVTDEQADHPNRAYTVLVRPDDFGNVQFVAYRYEGEEAV